MIQSSPNIPLTKLNIELLIDPIEDLKKLPNTAFLIERYFILLSLELQRSNNSSSIGLNMGLLQYVTSWSLNM
ncbi:hypothetical protein BpHYR1_023488 [Brachionus plicatilis]|uniref:Uncharacterized protein n=1 Tax=Brachionus plicatilis TaxID=10195 RepID=A0A3M7RMW7_BRAPC|nr:hypothetical protein BpHYR1_023488 [Brachionus plicatilis]